MTGILFPLDAAGRWRLAHDAQQWMLQRRKGPVRPNKGGHVREPKWRGTDYIGSEKRILYRCIGERGIVLTPEAQAQLDALPERFMAFLAEIDSPAPDNARTAAIQPSDGLERRPGQEALSTGIIGARMPKAA